MSKSSDQVSKPVEELVNYASSLELLILAMTFEDGSRFYNWQRDILKNIMCPHWDDIVNELKNKNDQSSQ